jgi:hypothetical protein
LVSHSVLSSVRMPDVRNAFTRAKRTGSDGLLEGAVDVERLVGDEQRRHVAVLGGAVLHEHAFREPDEAAGAERPRLRCTDALHEVTGADTADADAERADTDPGTPDVHTGQWTADRGHDMRGHWTFTRTPDAWTRPSTRTGRPRHGRHRTDIPDHHHPTARWDAEPWTCGRHLRRSATTTARRRCGDGAAGDALRR